MPRRKVHGFGDNANLNSSMQKFNVHHHFNSENSVLCGESDEGVKGRLFK